MSQDMAWLLERGARLVSQHMAADRIDVLAELPLNSDPLYCFRQAWRAAGLQGDPLRLDTPAATDLPFVAWRADCSWALVRARAAAGHWQVETAAGVLSEIDDLVGFVCISLPRHRPRKTAGALHSLGLVRDALLARKRIFIEAILATFLINLLTLAISLFSMQVFDRVIPNQGFNTLTVLTVGVSLAIALEFMLKQVRSYMVDRTSNAIDIELSEWFFTRLMQIRMEARPASVGTLAAQVKGFEMLRGVLTSTSLLVLADIPFALFFVVVIALVGGWLAVVPLVVLPLALGAGLLFQRGIRHYTKLNQTASNRKAGLLVEAADGAESLKAQGGEWRLQGRWNDLTEDTAESDRQIRAYAALAQNSTAALQQFGYVALIATGAWLVTDNLLTMGGLLACSIISNRALMPIVQLPGVMVQWAHARAAMDGLDSLIALPSEADEGEHALAPRGVGATLRLDDVRFAYGQARPLVLEVPHLEVRAGERVGVIGPIGSGKSTLLKVASGLFRPSEGKLFVADLDAALLSPAALRETIGYLPQDMRLFSGSLRDNLLLGLADPGDEAIFDAARATGLIGLISGQPKGLTLEISEGGRGVSGGQRQLIGLTRLLLSKPKIWILDEPTGSMDAENEARLVALLNAQIAPTDCLIVATHKTALLPLLTRLVVIREGHVVLDGPREQILSRLAGKT